MSEKFNFYKKDIIAVVIIFIVTTFLLFLIYDLKNADLSVPFGYNGTDTISPLMTAKMLSDSGTNLYSDRIGAPGVSDSTNDLIGGAHMADLLTMRVLLMMFGNNNYAKAVNLTFLTAFYMIALIAYVVFRILKLNIVISAGGGLAYAFMPFIFFRNVEHLTLSCYYFVPLAILMCLWLYEDEKFLVINRDFFKYKRNIFAIVMAALIASSGIMYWQFFACIFIGATGVIQVIKNKSVKKFLPSLTALVMIVGFLGLYCARIIFTIITGGGSHMGSYERPLGNAEEYCLKLVQMILPVRGHGIEPLQKLIDDYKVEMSIVNENVSAYLGVVGIIGLVILFVVLFMKKSDMDSIRLKRLAALSELNIIGILVGMIGGIGTVFFMFVSQTIRGYNRISVFIGFICILAVCICVDEMIEKIGQTERGRKNIVQYIIQVAFIVVVLAGIYEQNPEITFDYEENKQKWDSDKAFVSEIEKLLPEGASVFELPFIEYPEGGKLNELGDLELFIGYLHSDKLKWSFGSCKGSEEAEWYENVAKLNISAMVSSLRENKFSGIYIDRRGFEDEADLLQKELEIILGKKPIESPNRNQIFFAF